VIRFNKKVSTHSIDQLNNALIVVVFFAVALSPNIQLLIDLFPMRQFNRQKFFLLIAERPGLEPVRQPAAS